MSEPYMITEVTGQRKLSGHFFSNIPHVQNDSLLWKLESATVPGPSYLFGTMHVRDRRAFACLPLVLEKMEGCDAFAAEFDLGEAHAAADFSAMELPPGQFISQLLPHKKYARCRKALLKSTGMDIARLDQMRPFAVVNILTEGLLRSEMPEPLDLHLWGKAKAGGKALFGIETLAEQMAVLRQISLEVQLDMLVDLCQNVGKFRHYLLRLAAHYEAQRVQQLYQMVKRNSRGLRHLMIYRRNEVMASRVGDLASQQSTFVAIGAAHLGGGKGVLRQLKQRGWKLTPVRAPHYLPKEKEAPNPKLGE